MYLFTLSTSYNGNTLIAHASPRYKLLGATYGCYLTEEMVNYNPNICIKMLFVLKCNTTKYKRLEYRIHKILNDTSCYL